MSTALKFRWVNIQNPAIVHANLMKRLSGAETWVVKRVLFLLVDKAEKSSTVHKFTFRIHFHNWNLYSQTRQLWANPQCKHNTLNIKDRGSRAEGVGCFPFWVDGAENKVKNREWKIQYVRNVLLHSLIVLSCAVFAQCLTDHLKRHSGYQHLVFVGLFWGGLELIVTIFRWKGWVLSYQLMQAKCIYCSGESHWHRNLQAGYSLQTNRQTKWLSLTKA